MLMQISIIHNQALEPRGERDSLIAENLSIM